MSIICLDLYICPLFVMYGCGVGVVIMGLERSPPHPCYLLNVIEGNLGV